MFTVVFADDDFIRHADEYRLILQPFFDNKRVKFGPWDPSGETLAQMCPGLRDLVGQEREWRAVVIVPSQGFEIQAQNPFDVVRYAETAFGADMSRERKESFQRAVAQPLVRFGTFLSPPPDSAFETEGKDDDESPMRWDQARFLAEDAYRRELLATVHDPDDPDRHLMVPEPTELYYLSPRIYEPASLGEKPGAQSPEYEYSQFAYDNLYPHNAKYAVFDICERGHTLYEYNYVCFLEFLFAFATNDVPSGKMRSDRLYRAVCTNDPALLKSFFNRYRQKLSLTGSLLGKKVKELQEMSLEKMDDEQAYHLYCTPREVHPPSSQPAKESTYAHDVAGKFGLFAKPAADKAKWDGVTAGKAEFFERHGKRLNRMFLQVCDDARGAIPADYPGSDALTPSQMAEVEEFSLEQELASISGAQGRAWSVAELKKRMLDADARMREYLDKRMTTGKAALVTGVALMGVVLSFLPVWFIGGASGVSMAWAGVAFLLGCVLIAAVAAMVLMYYKNKTKEELHGYNGTVSSCFDDARSLLESVARKAGYMCDVLRSSGVLQSALSGVNHRSAQIRIYEKHRYDIDVAWGSAKGVYDRFVDVDAASAAHDAQTAEPYEFDFELPKSYTYTLPFTESDVRKIRYMGRDLAGEIPIPFISEIDMVREEIY
ncbi:MAG: hypothetical protein LBR77_01155 [Lachnospiraceae bacterium]|jgi:hypothetical protein|nr:hypothetical protein [Lachnospiraceae bacterium]